MFNLKSVLIALAMLLVFAPIMSSNSSIKADSVSTTVTAGDTPNAVANKVYVTNGGSGDVTVIDGSDNRTTTVAAGVAPVAVAVNPVTNKVYVANQGGTVTVIDGSANETTTVTAGDSPNAVAVNPVTNTVYVANFGDTVTVITPDLIQPSPLTTAIAPLPGDTTTAAITNFSFTATSAYTPTARPARQIYYQVDTQTGPWLRATPDGPGARGDTPSLRPGIHLLFAFATDGQETTSINTGSGTSPITGQVSAYLFLVVPAQVQSLAELSLALFQDPADEATGMKAEVLRVFDPSTGQDVAFPLHDFHARLTYDGTCVNVVEIREMDFTVEDIFISDAGGVATFKGTTPSGVTAPADLVQVLTRSQGSTSQSCPLTLQITSLSDMEGNAIGVTSSLVQNVRRGDARSDGNVTIADARFIARYLLGLRTACTDVIDNTCLHSVNAASARQDGAFDQTTIADALFIAQHLTGLRDEFFNLVPSPDVVAELGREFRLGIGNTANFESAYLKLTFLEVSEDSRCPSDVVCVWEGQATVVADLSVRGQSLGSFDLTLRAGNKELATKRAGRYRLTLVALEPYPISTHQIQPPEYQATWVISKAK